MNRKNRGNDKAKSPGRIWLRVGGAAAVVLLVLAWQAGLFVPKTEPGEVTRASSGLTGKDFVTAREGRIPIKRTFTGSVVPRFEIKSAPRIGGTVAEVSVEAGERVSKGDLLVRLDRGAVAARRDEAEARLREAEAARRGASRLLERITQAVAADTLPETRRIEAEQAAETAGRAVERAEAALRRSEVRLGYTEIRSTRDAVVIEALVEAGDQAIPGRPVALSYDPEQLELMAHVPASMAAHFPNDAEVACRIPAVNLSLTGTVRTRVPRADARSRTVGVKVTLDSSGTVIPGMYGTVTADDHSRRALIIPDEAIERTRQLNTVWVLGEDSRLNRRFVRTGKSSDGKTEILAGLRAGEKVALPAPNAAGGDTSSAPP